MKRFLAMLFTTATICAAAQDTTVIKMEYYVDADPGIGNATPVNVIPASVDVTFPFTIDLTGYTIGHHKLYIRTRDNLVSWSLTARRNFEVLPPAVQNKVMGGEYFIDSDPGHGAGSPIIVATPDTAVLQDFSAVLAGLTEGYHKLYDRFIDTHGNWSHTFRRNIEVIIDGDKKVINGEYFFSTDNGFDNCSPVIFTTPLADGTFTFNIPAAQVPADADTLFIRIRDDIQTRWSLTNVVDINAVLPLTLLGFTAVKHLNTVELNWQTTNEINTAYFNIQRSTDALHFTTIGVVNAINRTGVNNYSYADNITSPSVRKIYYRLQQVDIDAKSQYSKIAAISIDGIKTGLVIYPNPAKNFINIVAGKPGDLNGAVIAIVDMAGHVAVQKSLLATNEQQVNVSALPKGMYIIRVIKPTGVETQKLLIE
jgi:hypothetical protein